MSAVFIPFGDILPFVSGLSTQSTYTLGLIGERTVIRMSWRHGVMTADVDEEQARDMIGRAHGGDRWALDWLIDLFDEEDASPRWGR